MVERKDGSGLNISVDTYKPKNDNDKDLPW